ncbi:hypothetical protein EV363DRAFT_1163525, partial [Boletus edulis]
VSPPVVPGQTCYSLQAMASALISIVIIALATHLVPSSTCAFSGDLVAVQNSEWNGTTPSARYGHKRPTHVSTPSWEFGKYQRPEEASHFLTWIVFVLAGTNDDSLDPRVLPPIARASVGAHRTRIRFGIQPVQRYLEMTLDNYWAALMLLGDIGHSESPMPRVFSQ